MQGQFYNLSLGEPHLSSLPLDIWSDMAKVKESHRYYPYQGCLILRQALLDKYYSSLKLENIAITHGAIGAIDCIFRSHINAFREEWGEVLLPDPGFPPYEKLAAFSQLIVKKYNINLDDSGSLIDWDQLETQITTATKLIVLNSPHNPTGRLFTDYDCLRLIKILEQYPQLNFVMDEVYRELIFDQCPHIDLSTLLERGFLVGSFSKMYPLQGARVGWVVCSEKMMQKLIPFFSNAFGAVSSFGQELALNLLRRDIHFLDCYSQARKSCELILNNYQIPHLIPQGGFYYFLKFDGDDQLVVEQLKNHKVVVIPGSVFGTRGEKYIRICFAQKKSELTEAFQIIAKTWQGFGRDLYDC